jgi:hypothetical protein
MENERAIDEAKCGCRQLRKCGRQATLPSLGRAIRCRHHSGSLSPHRKRELFWGENRLRSVAEESEFPTVRGKAHREFFKWLEDQVQTDWRSRKLLERRVFENR